MPVGMPDGGRDALVVGRHGQGNVVYQVKYTRNPASISDRSKWVIDAIKRELSKIAALAEEHHVARYVMMTNMPGTSHFKSGSIDKVQQYMDNNLSMQGQCLWRDDLDRRLDPHIQLKLKYPGLISGEDTLALLWHLLGGGEGHDRRKNALDAYLAYQYEQDQRVRFKEVGLSSNSLFDLYVDVPASTERRRSKAGSKYMNIYYNALVQAAALKREHLNVADDQSSDGSPSAPVTSSNGSGAFSSDEEDEYVFSVGPAGEVRMRTEQGYREIIVGAAELLLSSNFMDENSCVVLEGAPGQGKSTLSQYLMQVQRARILARSDALTRLPEYCADYPVALPIKLELRDVALWLKGIDPWGIEQGKNHGKIETFEAALAGHIERYSGGVQFDVADLLAALANIPTLIVLDALDEVADLDDRRSVVDEVTAGLTRLQQRNQQIRALITSRPTSISKSPTFPRDKFAYLTLMPISHQLAIDYAMRWARARSLDERDSNELISVLRKRLDSPHISELAKNTMQLTILLWLISLRGPSLPDKRTDLYDTYFTVFMDRESEKDPVVRAKRPIILKLHMYLGFYLHATAEAQKTTGRISTDDLEALISHYLRREEQPLDSLADVSHAVDRIFALVSRVEGTWEFEVQPLQEYFAGRYLYNSAPYVVASREASGTKPVRFDGVARNPYWLNVTRFFAGCFTDGELLDLSDRVLSLSSEESTFGRTLAVSLLQDWVFAQSVKATRLLFEGLFNHAGLRWAGAQLRFLDAGGTSGLRVSVALAQPPSIDRLIEVVWPVFDYGIRTQRVTDAGLLLKCQVPATALLERWKLDAPRKDGVKFERWLDIGYMLDMLQYLDAGQVANLASGLTGYSDERVLAVLMRGSANGSDLAEEQFFAGYRGMLNTPVFGSGAGFSRGRGTEVGSWDLWMSLARMHKESTDTYYGWYLRRFAIEAAPIETTDESGRIPDGVVSIVRIIEEVITNRPHGKDLVQAFARSISIMHETFGPTLLEAEMACLSASISSGGERGSGASMLTDPNRSLPDRMRFARSQVNNLIWWREQSRVLQTDSERIMWIIAFFGWASAEIIGRLVGEFETVVAALPGPLKAGVIRACRRTINYARSRSSLLSGSSQDVRALKDPATISILAPRMLSADREALALRNISEGVRFPYMADMIMGATEQMFIAGRLSPEEMVSSAVACHNAGCVSGGISLYRASRRELRTVGTEWAHLVVKQSWSMPTALVAAAYRVLDETTPNLEPVLGLADRQNWFDGDDWGRH
jgi:hypothetical protein